jgi:hypothetical protein
VFTNQPEPWHISYRWTQDKMTKHDECLARIHLMEHQLEMSPEYNENCELCVSKNIDRLWNKVMYDPDLVERFKR